MHPNLLVVSAAPDEPLAEDIAVYCGQNVDYADILSLKLFLNGEFCPRFISDENDLDHIGEQLTGKMVLLVSASSPFISRNELVWRNCLIARAAKENGAARVALLQPDLFFAAQDRGPQPNPVAADDGRDLKDRKKFDGQAFSSLLHAQTLRLAGVDAVFTVHSHSLATDQLYASVFEGRYCSLLPAEVYAQYVLMSDVTHDAANGRGMLLCAPDAGARSFVQAIADRLGGACAGVLHFSKERSGERQVAMDLDAASTCGLDAVRGRDVLVFDDMIRTGVTLRECCRHLKNAGAARVVFFLTHFLSSREARENLSGPEIDEIVTTDTIPSILNRDQQGRLRRKMAVLKIAPWIARRLLTELGLPATQSTDAPMFSVDMSSKNPRYRLDPARTAR